MSTQSIRKFLILVTCLTLSASPVLAQRGDPTLDRVVYHLPNTDKVIVQADTVFKTVGEVQLKLDAYYPPTLKKEDRLPVVIFINGVGNRDNFPKVKTWGQYTNWPRLVAVSGMAAITYDSRSAETEADSVSLLEYVRANAAKLNINENKMLIWACSANGRVGTKLAFEDRPYINAAVFYYSAVNFPPLLRDLPLFIARAGLDNPNLNEGLDVLAQRATAQGLQVSFVNYAEGQHAFDLFDDEDQSREIIAQTIAFMKFHLTQNKAAQVGRAPSPGKFVALINTLGWAKALEAYESAKRTDPRAQLFTEGALNGAGYNLLQTKKTKEAIEVFKLVVAAYPNSANAYDSLADAYVEDGNKTEAVKNSEKALEMLEKDTTTPAQQKDQIRQSAQQKLTQLKGN